ncbi:hypothetical protein TGME49_290000 [Toxoplasma gondii ME49]|uniref:Uncharacterized protein n=1 Tax=Toxoplasma gondii (strain ATCC 50611 / Me49) TaxID=508771 RepID=S8EX27_TOXGM|nr:hypothetical protein TGME49_290000 [Toxoplasma gondii ME49]EPT27996.1 hypothetical protein TGME49_290000 [Toxoplasma gondii ME49]|eukprot:XP_002368425.1 hypothetical protein TGME49_290000 [Toxoplasma gondii ME49]
MAFTSPSSSRAAFLLLVSLSTFASVSNFAVRFEAAAAPADNSGTVTSTTTQAPLEVACSAPVHQQACTLDLTTGATGKFQCSNALPDSKFSKAYTSDGSVVNIPDIVPGAIVTKTGTSGSIQIPDSFYGRACFALTCSEIDSTPIQQSSGNPDSATAVKLIRYTLMVRVNGGTSDCADEPSLLPSSRTN